MNVIEIKGTVPGAGKTTALVKVFVKADIPNKVLLCPSNKDRQVCIEKAIDLGMAPKEAEKNIKTIKKFKENFFKATKDEEGKPYYVTKHSEPHYGKIWNIFIDEASMVSKKEMDDLIKNWRINNLLLAGDSLQFDPVKNKNAMHNGNTVMDVWRDEGLPYDLPVNHQFLLTKSLRSIDPKLTKAINLVKEGKIREAITLICRGRNLENSRCKYENTDWHTSYTNIACDNTNAKYKNPRRYIITMPDNRYKFWKSEILDIDDKRFVQLNDMLIMAKAKDPEVPLFDDWLKIHAKPAYAVTSYKLQGTTISKDKIYVHVTDLLYGLKNKTDEERAEYLQTHLYVAISRATSADQIEFCGFGENPLIEDINNRRHPLKKNDKGEYIPDLEENEIGEELKYFESLMKPLEDKSIREDAVALGGDDDSIPDCIIDVLEYDVSKVEDVPQEYKEMISKAHSGPRKSKWTDEKLKSYGDDVISLRNDLETYEEAYGKSYTEKLLTRYTELTGVVVPEETEEERKERLSKAHSKPRKNGWTKERIMSYTDKEELKKATRKLASNHRKKILARWEELHNVKTTETKTIVEEPKTAETKTIVEESNSNENVKKVQAVALITNVKEVEGVRRIEGKVLQKKEDEVVNELTHKHQSSKNYVDTEEAALEQSLDILIRDAHSRVE